MSAPTWESVDNYTADLLALVADEGHVSADFEWDEYVRAVRYCAELDGGLVRPNRLRPLLRGVVAPKRIGAFTTRAKAERLLVDAGEWEVSDDHHGRNAGRPMRVYRLATP